MKTKDRLKEEIGLDKLLMTILSAIASSIFGWLFSKAELSLTTISIFLVAVSFFAATVFFLVQIKIKIKELDYDW
jgi:hypothetical protein